jgi:hypothetical protein
LIIGSAVAALVRTCLQIIRRIAGVKAGARADLQTDGLARRYRDHERTVRISPRDACRIGAAEADCGASSRNPSNPNRAAVLVQSDPVGFMNPTICDYHFVLNLDRYNPRRSYLSVGAIRGVEPIVAGIPIFPDDWSATGSSWNLTQIMERHSDATGSPRVESGGLGLYRGPCGSLSMHRTG